MKVGVPTEIKTDEYRVALTPAGVRELVEHGHEVVIQAGAGEGSAISDARLRGPGRADPARRRGGVRRGGHDRQGQGAAAGGGRRCSSRATRCSPTCTWRPIPSSRAGWSSPARPASPTRPSRTSRGRLPLLAPMSEVAGKIATQAGAFMLEKPLGGRGILLGGVPGVAAANVMIIGGGVVGMNAAFIALGMEADGLRLRPQHRPPARARHRTSAAAPTRATRRRSRSSSGCRTMDLVIGAVLVHGAKAPYVIAARPAQADEAQRRAGRRLDRPGRLLRDLAARPRTRTRPTRSTASRTTAWRTCPARCRSPRTYALTNATLPYVLHVADAGVARRRPREPGAGARASTSSPAR